MGLACAGQAPPPGGPDDRRPPVVVRTVPDTFQRVGAWGGPVRFLFDERISERTAGGDLSSAVIVSPRTGAVSVDHGRTELSVRVEGGYQAGLVYRVTLLPVISDLFGNQLRNPFELVFTTGPSPSPTAVAGVVWDRITGQGTAGIEVRAGSPTQTATHVAVTGQQGIYALRYLPPGAYRLSAFEDVNRNGQMDFTERQGYTEIEVAATDTVLVDVPVLQPDTSTARLTDVSALDSVTLVLELDDYLDPDAPLEDAAVLVQREEGAAPAVERLFHEHEYAAWVAQAQDSIARLDSLEAAARAAAAPPLPDTAIADTLDPPPDTVALPDTAAVADTAAAADTAAGPARQTPPRRRGPTPLGGATGRRGGGAPPAGSPVRGPLPSQRIVVRLQSPIEPDVAYRVILTGVVNLNQLPGGGGLDSVRVVPDTAAAAGRGGRR